MTVVYLVIPPVSTLMVEDALLLRFPKRTWVPLDTISPYLIASVVAAEDGEFCEHYGFDFKQIEKQLDRAADGKRFGGASTITQQTAKNLFLWDSRSWLRKGLEAPLALWLELILSKRRILEIYLNIAEWGPGIYGAEAAARHHFKTGAAQLSLRQSALLAGALPNPIRRSAGRPGSGLLAGAALIEQRVQNRGPALHCLK